MRTSLKKRLVVALLLIAVGAVTGSVGFKSFALVFYAIALLALMSALILAIINVPPQQRKLSLILISVATMLVCGVGGYFLLNLLNAR